MTLGGYEVVTVPVATTGAASTWPPCGRVLDDDVAGIMLTNPNTLGLFEEDIAEIAAAVHEVGGLLYYDGANLNAILGVVRPGDMGFDIVHMNLHKTFATPHGGGGPGRRPGGRVRAAGAVPARAAAGAAGSDGHLRVRLDDAAATRSAGSTPGTATPWCWPGPSPTSWPTAATGCGGSPRAPCSTPTGSATGCAARYDVPYDRPCMHEFVALGHAPSSRPTGVRALDVAKRLLEEGFHAPTVYFPLIVDEALMIEPTETESPQTLEALADALERIAAEAATDQEAGWPRPPHDTGAAGGRGPGRPPPRPDLRRPALSAGAWTASSPHGSSTPTCGSTSTSTRRTDGRVGKHSNRVPALLLTTTGRRTGLPRTNGLTYCRDRGDIIVVASNGGSDRPPAWLLNLQAEPEVTVRLGRRVLAATARVATSEERSHLWPLVNRTNRGMSRIFHRGVRGRYDVYQRHTGREIAVVIITHDPYRPGDVPRALTGAVEAGTVRTSGSAQSRRSGCSRTIRSKSGWKLNQPAMCDADLAAGQPGHLGVDEHRRAGRLGQQLGLARALHGDEPPGRLVDRVPDGQQPVVAEDDGLVVAERVGDALALLDVEHHAGVVVEERVVLVEGADVLGDRVERAAERRPRLAVDRVRVGGGHHVGPGGVDLGVDGEGGPVDRHGRPRRPRPRG